MSETEYTQLMSSYTRAFKPVICGILNNVAYAWGLRNTIYTLRTPQQEYGWYIENDDVGVVISIHCENPNHYHNPDSWRLKLGKLSTHPITGLDHQSYFTAFPMTTDGLESISAYLNDWGPQHFAT